MTPTFIVPPDPFVAPAGPVAGEDELQAASANADADAITVAVPSLRSTLIGTPLRSGAICLRNRRQRMIAMIMF
jgi:hypothetical protein